MNADPLEDLLAKLSTGDAAAAEQVFKKYEPYLRIVVSRMLPSRLRPKLDSIDVVQSVWADLLDGFRTSGWRFRDADHLRAFLVKATRRRFVDRYRSNEQDADHEEPLPESVEAPMYSEDPRPSQVVQADELWQRMLALCPPEHRDVLLLKRQGFTPTEIAERTGYHASTVRRILYDLARQLAFDGDASSDGVTPPENP